MFRVGDFSKLARVTIKTLHHYDEEGLLRPSYVDPSTGYRYYEAAQLERVQRVLLLKDLGFSLDEIRALISLPLHSDELMRRLDERRASLRKSLEEDAARLRRLEALLARWNGSQSPALGVTLQSIPACKVHSVRARVPQLGKAVESLFEEAEATVARHGARAAASPMLLFHDGEFRESDLDLEICIPVRPQVPSGLPTSTLPASEMACVTYVGDYEQTPRLYSAMLSWLEASRMTIAGPLHEVYHRFGAHQHGYRLPPQFLAQTVDQLVTELRVPISRA